VPLQVTLIRGFELE